MPGSFRLLAESRQKDTLRKIFIYNGPGASPFGVKALFWALARAKLALPYQVAVASHNLLATTAWQQETDLLIFPGGRDIPYHDHLRGTPNQRIREFVYSGGRYLGICAGAYYGCAAVEFERGGPDEVCADRELCFFPGKAQGPALGKGKFCYNTHKGAEMAKLQLLPSMHMPEQTVVAYYNGGCTFVAAESMPHVAILANYATAGQAEATPAIVCCSVGKGVALLCGVHPEYSALAPGAKVHFSTAIYEPLLEIEPARDLLFHSLLKHLMPRAIS